MFTINEYMKHPRLLIWSFTTHFLSFLDDKSYLSLLYYATFGNFINWKNPKTFSEKLQWLKLYHRYNIYTTLVDKLMVKDYVSNIIGNEFVIPTLAVWRKADEIDISTLPKAFVLKTNHNSGSVIVCKNKNDLDINKVKDFYRKQIKKSGYLHTREWPYKNVNRMIFAEAYIENEGFDVLNVYKFFCFHGVPKIIQVIQNDKLESETIDYYDTNWNLLELTTHKPNSKSPLVRPKNLQKMLDIAKQLSCDFPFIRIDLYENDNEIFFSEYTFFSDSGLMRYEPLGWDEIMGSWIELPKEKHYAK